MASGKTIAVEVSPANGTIRNIKILIEEQEGIPFDQQVLLFAAKELDNNRTLHHYNIIEETTLSLVLVGVGKRKHEESFVEDSENAEDSIDSC